MKKNPLQKFANSVKSIDQILTGLIFIFVAASPFSISITQGALTLALIVWFIQMGVKKKWLVHPTPLDIFFGAFILLELVATVFSIDPVASLRNAKRLALLPIVYLIADNVRDEKILKTLAATLISVMTVLSLYGIVKYLAGVGGIIGRLQLFHHYMTSGGILMMIGLLAIAIIFSSATRRIKIVSAIVTVPIVISLIFTFTRSSWLGFAAGIGVIGLFRNRKLLIALIVLIALVVLLGPSSIQDRVLSIFDPTHPNNVERVHMWQAGLRIMLDYPLTGVGDIDLAPTYKVYMSPEAKEVVGHLHNNFLQFGAIMGIPGLIFIILLFARIIWMNAINYGKITEEKWILKATSLTSLAVSVAFVINGLFEWNFGDAETVMIFWMFAGLNLAALNIQRNEKSTEASIP